MKVTKKLNVSDKEFYQTIYESLKQEIEATTAKTYPKLYQSMHYQKELMTYTKIKQVVDVKIEVLIENKEYLASFTQNGDVNTINFKIEAVNSDTCIVTYEEKFVSNKNVREINFSIISFIVSPFKKRKAKKKLKAIEKYIIVNR